MDRTVVFTKTAKGITQVNQKSASLSKDLMKVLKLIDGKSNFGQLLEKAEVDKGVLEKALNTLAKDGFARIFETRKEEADPFAASEDDFDFTAPNKMPASTQRVIPGAAPRLVTMVQYLSPHAFVLPGDYRSGAAVTVPSAAGLSRLQRAVLTGDHAHLRNGAGEQ